MKSKPKNKGKRFVPAQKKRNLAAVSPEVLFAQKLAANDPILRNRAVKKLTKWLKLRSEMTTQEELMKLWKGLHYCYWMSDKPLVQEELAEGISSLIRCFNPGSEQQLTFIQSGLVTEGREWVGIDQWRMDKFMMLVRRFLRQIFQSLANNNWSHSDKLTDMFHKNVVSSTEAALGFRLHFTDIYLEELAKVGGENLAGQIILDMIQPFVKELSQGSDDRLANHITERIFRHLMRQSDLGIAHDEALDNDDDDDDHMEVEESTEEPSASAEESDEEELGSVADPRAGNVSVTLPQLNPDFNMLAEHLFKIGSSKEVLARRRSVLYDLTKQLKDMSQNVYPLMPDLSELESQIPKVKVGKLAKKKALEEVRREEQIKLEREEFKKALKRKKTEVIPTEEPTEDGDNSSHNEEADVEEKKEEDVKPPQSKKLKKNLAKSPQEEVVSSPKKLKKLKKGIKEPNSAVSSDAEEATPKELKKKKKPQDENSPAQESPKISAQHNEEAETPKKLKKKKKLNLVNAISEPETQEAAETPKKKKKKSREEKAAASPVRNDSPAIANEPVTPLKVKKLKGEKSADSPLVKKAKKNTPSVSSDSGLDLTPKIHKKEPQESSPKQKKKKKSKKSLDSNAEDESGLDASNSEEKKIFDDDDWNPDGGQIKATPSPSHLFFKKSKSQSAETLKQSTKHLSLLEKKRRISFALSQNKFSNFNDIDRSMQDSPDIPYAPDKKPKQGVLKIKSANNTPNSVPSSKSVLLHNTKINGKSKAAKKLGINYNRVFF